MANNPCNIKIGNQGRDGMDLDDLLPHVGEFGLYQKLLLWLVCLPACIPCGFGAFNQLFMADSPEHWCKVPDLINITGLSPLQRRHISIPQQVRDVVWQSVPFA